MLNTIDTKNGKSNRQPQNVHIGATNNYKLNTTILSSTICPSTPVSEPSLKNSLNDQLHEMRSANTQNIHRRNK